MIRSTCHSVEPRLWDAQRLSDGRGQNGVVAVWCHAVSSSQLALNYNRIEYDCLTFSVFQSDGSAAVVLKARPQPKRPPFLAGSEVRCPPASQLWPQRSTSTAIVPKHWTLRSRSLKPSVFLGQLPHQCLFACSSLLRLGNWKAVDWQKWKWYEMVLWCPMQAGCLC